MKDPAPKSGFLNGGKGMRIIFHPEQAPRPFLDAMRRGNVIKLNGGGCPWLDQPALAGRWKVVRLKQIHDAYPLSVWLERVKP